MRKVRSAPLRTRRALSQRPMDEFSTGVARGVNPSGTQVAAVPTPPVAVVILNRTAFGPRPGEVAELAAKGFEAYLDEQLDPGSIDDSETEQRLVFAGYTTLNKTLTQLWDDHVVAGQTDPVVRQLPLQENVRATLLRQTYSARQLFEVMVDFWHNHFSLFGPEVASVFPHFDREVIRVHALGNFRSLLGEVSKSTAMLYYLDNFTNSDDGPNENFARELFEIHTLGADNYFGVRPQASVPEDDDGLPLGYVDEDVYESTRCFTGWTVAYDPLDPNQPDPGTFYYRDDWHDRFSKRVLKTTIPSDQPALSDGERVLDLLVMNPRTHRHVVTKLCRRLLADDPPAAVIDIATQVFAENLQATDQMALVVRSILESPEFTSTWGEKVKRPHEILITSMRISEVEVSFALDDEVTRNVLEGLGAAGQPLFSHPAPDGFPDDKATWQSTSPRAMSWRMVSSLTGGVYPVTGAYLVDARAATPPEIRTATELADFWIDRIFSRKLRAPDRQEIIDFMAQGLNPDLDLPLDTDTEIQDRLQSMLGVLLMSPDFIWR